MKIAFFDTHGFEKDVFQQKNKSFSFEIDFLETRLTPKTVALAKGAHTVCSFVNDQVNAECLLQLKDLGIHHVALRSAGFNHVDILAAAKHGIIISRVPGYSPHAVAEFTLGLLLCLNRKIHKSYGRVKELNFSLDSLVGFDLHGKTVGVIGTGKIGQIFAQTLAAMGCKILANDKQKNTALESNPSITYCDLQTLCQKSDVISLHVPLTPETHHLIDDRRIAEMKYGALLINTGRGALIDAKALIDGLKDGRIGGAALDVYEEEEGIFFHDLSNRILKDDVLARLLTFPNVLVTAHQAFLTNEALENIAQTTLESINEFAKTGTVSPQKVVTPECCVGPAL